MIKYRKASAMDFQLVFDIKSGSIKPYIQEIWGWDDELQLKYHQADFNPENILIILDHSNKEIGLIDTSESDGAIFVKSILIYRSQQGNGVGTAVITDIIQRSVLTNKPIELQVFKINVRARVFYERLGFEVIGQTELHYQMIRNI